MMNGAVILSHAWRHLNLCMALAAASLLAACGGSLYKVKPVVEVPITEKAGVARAGEVDVRAVPLLTDEESQELFEANLLLGGLLPVHVEITNSGNAPIALERVRFRLRDATGQQWKARSPKQAIARIMEANEVYLYNPNSRARFVAAFSAHALDTKRPLAAAESRRGLIFFQTPKKDAIESPHGLILTIEKLPQPIELRLN